MDDPIRRSGICAGHGSNECVFDIIAALGNGSVFAAAMFGLGRLALRVGHAHGLGHLLVRDVFCRSGTRFQPVLGLDHRPAVVLRSDPIAGFQCAIFAKPRGFCGQAVENKSPLSHWERVRVRAFRLQS